MTKAEIKEYLENYSDKRMVAEYKRKRGKSDCNEVVLFDTINECIENLPEEYAKTIKMHYIHKVSLRTLAKQYFTSKTTLGRKRDEAIALIAVCLNDI